MVNTTVGSIWIDNFCKKFKHRRQTLAYDSYQQTLWTVWGYKISCDQSTDFNFQLADDGSVIPICPDTWISQEHSGAIRLMMRMVAEKAKGDYIMNAVDGNDGWALCIGINNVPLKFVDAQNPVYNPQYHDDWIRCNTADGEDGLTFFRPLGITKDNIGSNVGFFKAMQTLLDRHKNDGRYYIILSDINIFDRIVKVPVSFNC